MASILLIEDDPTFARILEGFLQKKAFATAVAKRGQEGLKLFNEQKFDLVLLDYRLPDMSGDDVLAELKAQSPQVPVVIMTSFVDIRTAVKSIKAGAFEYITKPVNPDELLMLIQQALKTSSSPATKTSTPTKSTFVRGNSEASEQLHKYIALVAPTDMSVIIEGESGTGKEYVARSIHQQGKRSAKPFVAVDCGALSKDLAASELFGHVKGAFTGATHDKRGQFEAASGGTLFLDEVGNLSYDVQVKLLRAIQERIIQPVGGNAEIKIDVRIITATNDDLLDKVSKGQFREDLYHRLNEFKLKVPAVRERLSDIDDFIQYFIGNANEELGKNVVGLTKEVSDIFYQYDWPGNLRELKNVIKRAVLLTPNDRIEKEALPIEMLERLGGDGQTMATPVSRYDLKAIQENQERELIVKTLEEVRYNKSKAARLLNIDRKTLYLKMEKYGIQ
jgi:two-component system response regulator HydG